MGKTAINPTRQQDYAQWYQQVVAACDLAEKSPVRGCMVIKPWGYAIWENMVKGLDLMFKKVGVENAYFPIFIPLSFLEKEAEHVEGFAKECAVVTHHRLEKGDGGGLVPAGRLTEPLVVRPTSETIIGDSFSRWISSYRDLPVLINQWANIVRWEMRTRIFLRTSEFLWQEGHTAHARQDEAVKRTKQMLDIYRDFAEKYLAMPVICGEKTESERFPGAVSTLCIEAMMQDRKALQAGTSHFLGQNFAKASDIKFQDADEKQQYAWTTSWGTSTRLIGGLIMTHGDDDGLILPPRVAPCHIVIMPILRDPDQNDKVMTFAESLAEELRNIDYYERKIEVKIDDRVLGSRNWDWIKKGVPVRVEIGPRDIAENSVFLARRDKSHKEKISIKRNEFVKQIVTILDDIQNKCFQRALSFREENTLFIDDFNEFQSFFTPKDKNRPEIHGGFAMSMWCGSSACEEKAKEDFNITVRCIPFDMDKKETGKCIICGKPSNKRVVFAKAY